MQTINTVYLKSFETQKTYIDTNAITNPHATTMSNLYTPLIIKESPTKYFKIISPFIVPLNYAKYLPEERYLELQS